MPPPPKATPRLFGEAAALELDLPLAGGVRPGEALLAHFHAPEALVLLREAEGAQGFFAGSLASLSLADAFAHVLSGLRTGQLLVQQGAVRKSVLVRDAQVVWATSSERHERLGAALVRLGLVTQAQLLAGLREVKPGGLKLGQALVRTGALSEANLYSGMTYLVRELVVDLFTLEGGAFLFLEGPLPDDVDQVKLPGRTRDLVLAGLKRGEAVARLRARVGEDRVSTAPDAQPAPGEEALLRRAEGGVALQDLRPLYEGNAYEFLTWVEERLREGTLVREAEAPAPAPTPTPAPVPRTPEERYLELLALVVRALEGAGRPAAPALRGFLERPPPGLEAAYAGVALSDAGVLDVGRLRENVAGQGPARARAAALEALDAFVSYALFSAKNTLPPDVAARLVTEYRAVQEGRT